MDEWNLLDLSYLVLSYDAAAGAGGSIVTSSSAASSVESLTPNVRVL